MRRPYGQQKRLGAVALSVIAQANEIIEEYAAQGFELTLRQLYYQFVARGLIPNRNAEYKRLGAIVGDGRMAGLIDWTAIVDRTRNLRDLPHWGSPDDIIAAAAQSYRRELWETQPFYVEVWIEKDALIGVIEPTCEEFDVPFFSCRGYTSASEMFVAAGRLRDAMLAGKEVRILHLGDHDPSGLDMTRDISDRLVTFVATDLLYEGWSSEDVKRAFRGSGRKFGIHRLALNMDQVEEFEPPPNPAKLSDSRAAGYVERYGRESWELDALDPRTMDRLIRTALEAVIEPEAWEERRREQETERERLEAVSARWAEVEELVR